MPMVGAGWHGYHLLARLQVDGHECVGWEARDGVLLGSSGFNQNRLDLGFHYPRNHVTRTQSREDFDAFLIAYPDLATPITRNVYAVASDSFLDFRTFEAIFRHEGYSFTEVHPEALGISGCVGAIVCDERVIRHQDARRPWSRAGLPIHFNQPVLLRDGFLYSASGRPLSKIDDQIIDCTWGSLPLPEGFYREHFLTFVIRCNLLAMGALTVMDGPFFSIYPFQSADGDDDRYTLTHVKLGVVPDSRATNDAVDHLYRAVVDEVKRFSPSIVASIRLDHHFVSVKLKPASRSDSRDVRVARVGNVISVLSGKIDAIFTAEKLVMELLATGRNSDPRLNPAYPG